MTYTPKDREELIMELSDGENEETGIFAERFIERIEALGIRLVPAEASDEMLDRANYHCGCGFEDVYKNLVAVSPYTQEKPNG